MVFGVIFSAFIISGTILVLGNIMIISGFLITNLYGFHFCIVTFTNIDNRGAWNFEYRSTISNKERYIHSNVLFRHSNHRISHVSVSPNDITSSEVDP